MTALGSRLDLIYAALSRVKEPAVKDAVTIGIRPNGPEANRLKNDDPGALEQQLSSLTDRLSSYLNKEDINRPVDGVTSGYGEDSAIAVKELYRLQLIRDQLIANQTARQEAGRPQKPEGKQEPPVTQRNQSSESQPAPQAEIPFEKVKGNLTFLLQRFNEDLAIPWDQSKMDFENEDQVRTVFKGLQEIWKAYNADSRPRFEKGGEFRERIRAYYASQGLSR